MAYPAMCASRFWKKVILPEDLSKCWTWPRVGNNGYGKTTILKKHYAAHRLSWMFSVGAIPKGLCVCHKCDVPTCVNPSHLFLGTSQENTADKVRKGRQARRDKIVNAAFIANMPSVKGSTHGGSRLKDEQVLTIRRLRTEGRTLLSISEEFGISKGHTASIIANRRWSHI